MIFKFDHVTTWSRDNSNTIVNKIVNSYHTYTTIAKIIFRKYRTIVHSHVITEIVFCGHIDSTYVYMVKLDYIYLNLL